MAKIDTNQIDRNRRTVANSTLESPWNTQIEDSDADFAQPLFDELPIDRVGFMPPLEDK
jgi:hypothetical protein